MKTVVSKPMWPPRRDSRNRRRSWYNIHLYFTTSGRQSARKKENRKLN